MEAKLRSGCLDDVLVKKISAYNDSRIAIIDELQSLNIEQAVKVEAYIILLCVKGKGFALYQWRIENDTRERFVHLPS